MVYVPQILGVNMLKPCVLIPAYNESAAIGDIIRQIRRQQMEVVVVDDGSGDNTAQISREAGEVVLSNLTNHGKGFSLIRGLKYALYSKMADTESCEAVLVDRMGVLNTLYAVSDIAFVGGTLVAVGGHNLLEPVWAGIPVLYGPSLDNVRDSSEYII